MSAENKHTKTPLSTADSHTIREPTDAWGLAEKEKWKAVQKGLPLAKMAGRFIGTIVGPAAAALGGLLGDQMKAWRAANLDRIAQNWEQKRRERNIPNEIMQTLPFRDAVLVLDAASMEDNADVQELWARLIFCATSTGVNAERRKMHVDLLKSLNGLETRVLMQKFDEMDITGGKAITLDTEWLKKINQNDLRLALQNLQRLGIITPSITELEIMGKRTVDEWEETITVESHLNEFKNVITNLVLELTNLTGDPMNDINLTPEDHAALVFSHGLTRIGFDLYEATDVDGIR